MTPSIPHQYLADALALFRQYQRLAEKAMTQVDDHGFFAASDAEANSIAILVNHMAGNQRSRWTGTASSSWCQAPRGTR
jgi:hypothetical protein